MSKDTRTGMQNCNLLPCVTVYMGVYLLTYVKVISGIQQLFGTAGFCNI